MIECPICHVMNEDQSFFCSECGQRFSPAQSTGFPQQSTPWQGSAPPPSAPQTIPPQPPSGYAAEPGYQPGLQPFAPEPQTGGGFPPATGAPLFQPQPNNNVETSGAPEHPADAGRKRPRLHSPILGGGSDDEDDFDSEPPQAPTKRGGLRSPLLRGDDEEPTTNKRGRISKPRSDDYDPGDDAGSHGKGRGLRSPLLGGEDEPDELPQQRGSGKRSGSLRSPLLRGDDADEFDKPKQKDKTGFPHRRRAEDFVDDDDDIDGQGRSGGRPLRSPLLGGADGEPHPGRRSTDVPGKTPTGGHRRLHSPVLDGTGEFYYDDYAAEESEPYDEDDPNVLRSPLLAARQKVAVEKPQPAPAAPSAAPHGVDTLPPALTTPLPPVADSAQHAEAAQPYVAPVTVPPPAPKIRPVTPPADEHEHQSRVPLSIYDSGLRQTIPGETPVRTGPSIALLIPCVIALICKGLYFVDVMKVPNIMQQTWFLADQFAQALVLIGVIIFAMNAKRS